MLAVENFTLIMEREYELKEIIDFSPYSRIVQVQLAELGLLLSKHKLGEEWKTENGLKIKIPDKYIFVVVCWMG